MKKILIIEDDAVISSIYRSKYEAAGYDVAVTDDGEAGLRMIKETKPDLVQLDLTLPKVDGVEIIRQIRAWPEFATLPIIVLSNSYLSEMVKAAWQAGATKCLSKLTCTPKLMLECISEVMAAGQSGTKGVASPAAASPEPQFDAARMEVRQEFQKRSGEMLASLRKQAQVLAKTSDGQNRSNHLQELFRAARFLTGYAGLTGFLPIAQLAGALETLLHELHSHPDKVTPSNLRTITNAVDALGLLLDGCGELRADSLAAALILVVDDEPISRQALATALRKANLRCVRLGDPCLALKLLAENQFDLIFLDVEMPEMDGFTFCKQVRALPANKTTPVVFVTGRQDFGSRAQSILSGGNDLIAKPFLLIELAVKALTCLVATRVAVNAPKPGGGVPTAAPRRATE